MKTNKFILSLILGIGFFLSYGCKTNEPVRDTSPQIINTNINLYLPPVSYS